MISLDSAMERVQKKILRKKKRRRKVLLLSLLILLFVIGTAFAYFYYTMKDVFTPPRTQGDNIAVASEKPGRVNILLLGVDDRHSKNRRERTDTIIFASIDSNLKKVVLVSIPRDTRVNIPGHGWDKINAAHVVGGIDLTKQVVSDLLGKPVDYYVLVNFEDFKKVIDTLGGVTIDVEKDMYHADEYPYTINLKKGRQHLNGEKALMYVRYRSDALGDISRTQRQQKFLKALAEQALQPGTLLKLPKLIPEIIQMVETDMSTKDLMSLLAFSRELNKDSIITQTLPGYFYNYNGVSYWQADLEVAKNLVDMLFAGQIEQNIVLGTKEENAGVKIVKKKKTVKTPKTSTTKETYQKKPATGSDTYQPNPGNGSGTDGDKATLPPGTSEQTTPPAQNDNQKTIPPPSSDSTTGGTTYQNGPVGYSPPTEQQPPPLNSIPETTAGETYNSQVSEGVR
ncbi:LCP family protein [Carboxydothermus hydrogenoformans]|nr:LCP family protein [Carboxydothermus hydrogenoformans]